MISPVYGIGQFSKTYFSLVGDQLIGPHIFEGRVTGEVYLKYLRDEQPCLLEDMPLKNRQHIIF